MPPLNLVDANGDPILFANRPVKPLSLALLVTMLVICWNNITDTGLFGANVWGDVVAVAAGAAAVSLAAGWGFRSQPMAEWGLALAASVWFTRGTLALLLPTSNPKYGWMFSYAWVIAALGAFFLERMNPRDLRQGAADDLPPGRD